MRSWLGVRETFQAAIITPHREWAAGLFRRACTVGVVSQGSIRAQTLLDDEKRPAGKSTGTEFEHVFINSK